MNILEPDLSDILGQLQQAYQSGQRWVTFAADELLDEKSGLGFYSNLEEAGEACEYSFDRERYLLARDIPSTLRELTARHLGDPLPETDVRLVKKALRLDPSGPLHQEKDLVNGLVHGELRTIILENTIRPLQAIDRFLVIGHQFPKGMIYEEGHEVSPSLPFSRYQDAYEAFQRQASQVLPNESGHPADYLLAGIFKGQTPELTLEGAPASHCGLVLYQAWPHQLESGASWEYQIYQTQSLYEPAVIKQPFLVQYNELTGQLDFLNGALDKVDPLALKRNYGLAYDDYIDRHTVQIYPTFQDLQEKQRLSPGLHPEDPTKNLDKANDLSTHLNTSFMEDKAMRHNESELKSAGLADAFTPGLIQKTKDGLPYIKEPYEKVYDGDKVNAVLHLKKSASSDYYFLNKMDLQLQKQGQENWISQTFYVTQKQPKKDSQEPEESLRPSQKLTFKRSYNMLAGRPVFDHAQEAWFKLNLKKILSNGNHEINRYDKNFGFRLEDVLSKYSIRELATDEYRQSLLDSLHRGNLQKVTFVGKDGREEKLHISPNILLGSLNVYDQNKQRVPTEKLIDQDWVSKSLGFKLINYAAEIKTGELIAEEPKIADTRHKPDAKEELSPKPKQKQTLKEEKPATRKRHKIK